MGFRSRHLGAWGFVPQISYGALFPKHLRLREGEREAEVRPNRFLDQLELPGHRCEKCDRPLLELLDEIKRHLGCCKT